jgi:uncharacterized membrane protein HdeD (DUF308 family)
MNAGGALVGALIHARVTSPVLTVVLGVLLIFAGIIGVSGYAERMRFSRRVSWIAGAASGGFGELVGNQGGIRSAARLGLEVQGPAFVATATAIGLAVDAVRMPVYFVTAAGRIFNAWPAIVSGIIGVAIGLSRASGSCAASPKESSDGWSLPFSSQLELCSSLLSRDSSDLAVLELEDSRAFVFVDWQVTAPNTNERTQVPPLAPG